MASLVVVGFRCSSSKVYSFFTKVDALKSLGRVNWEVLCGFTNIMPLELQISSDNQGLVMAGLFFIGSLEHLSHDRHG